MKCLNCKEEMDGTCEHIIKFKLCCECHGLIAEILRNYYKHTSFRDKFLQANENGKDELIEQAFKLYIQKNYSEIQ